MKSIHIIRKFIESHWIIERAVREFLERIPLSVRHGISYGPTFRYWLGFLKESEQWDRDRLEAYQVEQLRDLLIHAGKYVPYYRRIFEEYGFRPEKIQNIDDMKMLPYTEKEIIRDNINEFIAMNIPKKSLFEKTTSGSTGIPLTVFSDKEAEEKHWATVVHAWSKVGYSPYSRLLTLWGDISKGKVHHLPWKRYARQLILSRHYFYDEAVMNTFITMIREFKPEFIYSLPSSLILLANFIRERGIFPFEGIRACIIESEAIYPWQREIIETTFHTCVFSTYGMVEKALYASECVKSSVYHLYSQYGVPETVKLQNGIFEIIGTGLINYVNPLIRYRTADRGMLNTHSCLNCNTPYQSLDVIEGRLGDLLIDRDGNVYTPVRVGVDSDVFASLKMFQFYQDTLGRVILRIVKKESYPNPDVRKIKDDVMTNIGLSGREDKMEIEVVFVDDVSRTPSGKFSMVEQMLDTKKFLEGRMRVDRYHDI